MVNPVYDLKNKSLLCIMRIADLKKLLEVKEKEKEEQRLLIEKTAHFARFLDTVVRKKPKRVLSCAMFFTELFDKTTKRLRNNTITTLVMVGIISVRRKNAAGVFHMKMVPLFRSQNMKKNSIATWKM